MVYWKSISISYVYCQCTTCKAVDVGGVQRKMNGLYNIYVAQSHEAFGNSISCQAYLPWRRASDKLCTRLVPLSSSWSTIGLMTVLKNYSIPLLLLLLFVAPSVLGGCDSSSCKPAEADKINVHILPHSHDDVGWLKTVGAWDMKSMKSTLVTLHKVDEYFLGSHRSGWSWETQRAGVTS